ncbi:TorD/DmsD family molecular chaperone [Chthonobacter rhizosphaerae]|uniref:TorD/DmsD family molecular chaperone n=1 Tax=Chthonobacter rhizosphaerae TaxID=2735553 RepID=UPI0015EF3A64|nr:molecular chaperone TorD family protein [Chthonobacter rhizosphaerae]
MSEGVVALTEADANRARVYMLLAAVLAQPPNKDLLSRIGRLNGGDGDLGAAIGAVGRTAAEADADQVRRQFDRLFIGLSRGELVPYASYYRTGFLQDRPLIAVRADLKRLGLARVRSVPEPEDHIAALLETMAVLIDGRFGTRADELEQLRFFDTHLAPWAPRFFTDLSAVSGSPFYAAVGALGSLLLEIEAEAFALL